MLEFIHGPSNSGKTAYAKQLDITKNNSYVFLDAALYPNKKDINLIAAVYAANGKNIVVDNAHLLTKENTETLRYLVDNYDITIKAVGLKTDTNKNLFEGAAYLFALCDIAIEMETYCECGEPAVFSIRTDINGNAVLYGEQINERAIYKPVCSKCYNKYIQDARTKENIDMIKELQAECGI